MDYDVANPAPVAPTNGDLPPARVAVIDQAHRLHQEVSHERDTLRLRVADLMTEIAGLKAQLQIAELTASQLQNKTDSMMSIRDEAVVRRTSVETVLEAMMALGRAFQIANAPLIKEMTIKEIKEAEANAHSSGLPRATLDDQ